MTWGELLNSVAVGASILGAILGLVTWALSARTDRLIRAGAADTQRLIREVHEVSQTARDRMEARLLETLERMDARAEARHRETRE
jgi:hypothetical protein